MAIEDYIYTQEFYEVNPELDEAETWGVQMVLPQPMVGGRILYIDGDKIKALPEAQ
jgi:hypothetical protein